MSERRTFLGHPAGLGILAGVEMWERFSYYGMRALLILYLVNGLHWSDRRAASLYGTYTGLAYAVQIVGGALADRLLGTRGALVIGGTIIALGHFVLAIPGTAMLYVGLGLVVAGTGLFKPNVSTMVGQLYGDDLERRDAGFTIFYIGINLGATIAPFITGYLAQRAGWHWGFGAAGVGMTLGLALFAWGSDRYLHGIGKRPAPARRSDVGVTDHRGEAVGRRIAALLVVFAFVAVFWMGYEQAGSSVNLFTDRHVDRRIGGFETPTAWYQSIQPLAVLVLAPIFAALWGALGRRRREPSTPAKIAIGLAVLAVSFIVLAFAGRVADAGRLVAPWWIVLAYVIQVVAEMCISPVGLSYVTKVAPARFASLLMAAWFLATGVGDKLAGTMAGIAPSMSAWRFFLITAGAAGAAAVLIVPVVPWLRRSANYQNPARTTDSKREAPPAGR